MEPLELIKINSSGPLVTAWQFFLKGKGFYEGDVTGKFDDPTKEASMEFQKSAGLQPDGVIGNKSFGLAMQQGFEGVEDNRKDKSGSDFPAAPDFSPLTSNPARQKVFGVFTFVHAPVPGNFENISVTNNWAKTNITTVKVPQMSAVTSNPSMQFHKLAASQLVKLWADWEKANLLHLILSFSGAYVPRFARGLAGKGVLSNHAFGSAFDINVPFNGLGAVPALVGQKGSVRELVAIANENGFYWGGHFSRKDGMHFEIAKIL